MNANVSVLPSHGTQLKHTNCNYFINKVLKSHISEVSIHLIKTKDNLLLDDMSTEVPELTRRDCRKTVPRTSTLNMTFIQI